MTSVLIEHAQLIIDVNLWPLIEPLIEHPQLYVQESTVSDHRWGRQNPGDRVWGGDETDHEAPA